MDNKKSFITSTCGPILLFIAISFCLPVYSFSAEPGLDLVTDGSGVMTWTKDSDDPFTAIRHFVKIVDYDGINDSGTSHTVTVTYPTGGQTKTLGFVRKKDSNAAFYELLDDSIPQPLNSSTYNGNYIYRVEDSDGDWTEVIDNLAVNLIDPVNESSFSPNFESPQSIAANFDYVYVNSSLYDHFDSGFDLNKWNRLPAWVTYDSGEAVFSDVYNPGRGSSLMTFNNPDGIYEIRAKVRIDSVSGIYPGAQIGGSFGRNATGDIHAYIGIRENEAFYLVRSENWIENHYSISELVPATSLGSVVLGNNYEISIHWDESIQQFAFTVIGLNDSVNYTASYSPPGPVYGPNNPEKGIGVTSPLILDTTSPTIDWSVVSGANHYLVEIYNPQDISVFSGTITSPPFMVPPGILKPNSIYKYRIIAVTEHQGFEKDNASATDLDSVRFTTGSSVTQTPYLDLDSKGVYSWSYPPPFYSPTFFYVRVHDAQGVVEEIRSVKVLLPDESTEVNLYLDTDLTPTCGIYRGAYFGPNQAGSYEFTVEDRDGHTDSLLEEFTPNPIGPQAEELIRPVNNSVINSTDIFVDWRHSTGESFHQLNIYDKDLNYLFDVEVRDSETTIPPGLLRENCLYRYRIYTWREFLEINVDNGSTAPYFEEWNAHTFFTSQKDGSSAVPTLDIGKFGVAVLHVPHPETGDPLYYLEFIAKVLDADGVPENIEQVEVTYPDGSTQVILKYFNNPDWDYNYYENEIYTDASLIQHAGNSNGEYEFRVVDFEGHVATFTDTLPDINQHLIDWVGNASPSDGSQLSGLPVIIAWDAEPGAEYYKVVIMSAWAFPMVHMSDDLTEAEYTVPGGILGLNETHGYRIYAFNEPIGSEVDFYSSNHAWHATNDHFTVISTTPDTTPPSWNSTIGIALATDAASGGRVTVEFGTANDDFDGTNVKYNIYYNETLFWDQDDWSNNTLLLDVTPVAGSTYTHAYSVSGLSNDLEYTFGVRVADHSGNEETNTTILTAIPTQSAPDLTPPIWDNAVGIASAVDTTGGGSVIVEFDTATDDVDGTNVKFSIYYAETALWDDGNWSNNSLLANVSTATGSTYAHAYTVNGLNNEVNYTFGVRVEDQSGNEDGNSVTLNATPTSNSSGSELYFTTVADAVVFSSSPTSNYGDKPSFVVDSDPVKISYLRFNVSGLNGPVVSARIQLECINASPEGGTIYTVSDNSWQEATITYNNRPGYNGTLEDTLGVVLVGDIVELDVTSAVTGNGTFSFAIVPTSSNSASYRSKEDGANPPELIITTTAGADTTAPLWNGATVGIGSAEDTTAGGSVRVEFDTASDDVDGANVKFNIYYAETALWDNADWSNNSVLADVSPAAGSTYTHAFTVTGLSDDVNYTFGVRVEDQSGNEDTNATALIATPTVNISDTTAPLWNGATVGIGSAEDTTAGGSVRVEFDTASDDVDGANVKFNIYYAETALWDNADWSNNSVLADVSPAAGSTYTHAFTVTGLSDDVNYTFGVRVEDQSGNEDTNTTALTATPTVNISDTTAPLWNGATVGIGSAEDTTAGGSVRVEFDTASDDVDGANVKFNIYYAETALWDNADWSNNSVLADVSPAAGSTYTHAFTVTGLSDDVNYTFGVRVEDQSGNEDTNTTALTATPTVNISDTTAPLWNGATVGIGSAVDTTAGGSVRVEFDTASDDVDGANVKFNIYYAETALWDNADWSNNSVLADVSPAAGSTYTHAFTVTGLSDDVNYTFGVRVEDQSGNEDTNATALIATPTVNISDTTAPLWNGATVGIGSAEDTTAGGSVRVEFDTASDDVDGANVKFNIYYAETALWDNADWSNNSVLADVSPAAGSTYTHAFTVTGLSDDVNYTFGVRVEDQSGNEDTNTTAATATPTGGAGGNELIFAAIADSVVFSNKPTKNYGGKLLFVVDASPEKISYLRFEVTGVSGTVLSARVRLECTNASQVGGTIYSFSDNSWQETTVTYDTRPVIDGSAWDSLGTVNANDVVEFDVTSAITGNGTYNFALDSSHVNAAAYRSREDGLNPPTLIITINE